MDRLRAGVEQIDLWNDGRSQKRPLLGVVCRAGNHDSMWRGGSAAACMHVRHRDLAAICAHLFAALVFVGSHFNAGDQAKEIWRYEPNDDQ